MTYTYKTRGVCAQKINIEIDENGKVGEVQFFGGCDGNHKGICSLIKGEDIDKVIEKLEGVKCGFRQTSCPDQLAQALKEIKKQ